MCCNIDFFSAETFSALTSQSMVYWGNGLILVSSLPSNKGNELESNGRLAAYLQVIELVRLMSLLWQWSSAGKGLRWGGGWWAVDWGGRLVKSGNQLGQTREEGA